MPTPKKGARLGGSPSHQKHILANLAAQLFINDKIKTTDAKAKLLRPYVEKLITKAKSGTLADRRNVLKVITDKAVVHRLFNELAPQFEGRNGGYTRIIKLENRRGDNAPMSQISLVLEPTVSTEADRLNRVAASKNAEEAESKKAESEASAEEKVEETAEAPAAEADTEAVETEDPVADSAEAESAEDASVDDAEKNEK